MAVAIQSSSPSLIYKPAISHLEDEYGLSDSEAYEEEEPLIARVLEALRLDRLDVERDSALAITLRDVLLSLNSVFNPNYCAGKSDIEDYDFLSMPHVQPLNRAALIGGAIAVVGVSVMAKILCAPLTVLVVAAFSTALLAKLMRDFIFLRREQSISFSIPGNSHKALHPSCTIA